MRKIISQREARRLQKKLTILQEHEWSRARAWSSAYPGGVQIDTLTVLKEEHTAIQTAWMLGHAVIVKPDKPNVIYVYAVKP